LTLALTGCHTGSGKPRVAFVSNNAHSFWTFAEKGAQKAANEFGVELTFRRPPDGSAKTQREMIQDLLNRGFKGVAVSPNDPKNNLSFYQSRVAPKMALVMTDNDLPDPSARKCYIGTHNYRAGRAAGELVKKALPKGGTVAIFVGQMDATNAVERRQGLLDELAGLDQKEMDKVTPADTEDLELGNGYTLLVTKTDGAKQEVCQSQAQDLLIKHPTVGCLVGLWEYNPPAILAAVSKKKGAKPAIVAFDENDLTLEGIKNDEVVGTIVQNPYQFGYQSVKVLAGLAQGKDDILKTWPGIEKDNSIFVPHRVITKENVSSFQAEVKKLLAE
jgi:ribose transport system substrate-binding protein